MNQTVMNTETEATRLQLGASRLENLDPSVLERFLDPRWIHLCDPEPEGEPGWGFSLSRLQRHSFSYLAKAGLRKVTEMGNGRRGARLDLGRVEEQTNTLEFYYGKGDTLPFESGSMDFIFSEHFFEHLFLDEALALFRECRRLLAPYGVIRTCVPDADLRTYEPPEPIGFPDPKLRFDDPSKHKTRWSVYSLSEVLRFAGFTPSPLRYCDKSGRYTRTDPESVRRRYARSPDQSMVLDLSCIRRIDSLVVDGINGTFVEDIGGDPWERNDATVQGRRSSGEEGVDS